MAMKHSIFQRKVERPKWRPEHTPYIYTVFPDVTLDAAHWVTHHAEVNKVRICLADRPVDRAN